MLYRVNALDEVFVLEVELRQLVLDEPLASCRPLRTLVGDAARRDGVCT
jgi:hypothetical protein